MLSETAKIRLVRSILGNREMRAKGIISEAGRLGFPAGRQIDNWLNAWAKSGAVVQKVGRGLFQAGTLPTPPSDGREVPTIDGVAAAPMRLDDKDDGLVDNEEVLRNTMVWFRSIVEGQRCQDCGSVAVTGPVLNAAKRYQDAALELYAWQQGKKGKVGDAELHRLKRDTELLTRDLADAKRRIRELEAAQA